MSEHQTRILNYLKDLCIHTQWHENLVVLAPFERSSYLQNVSKVGIATLALSYPDMKVWEVIASPPKGIRSKRHIDWVAEHEGAFYTVEGHSSLKDVESMLEKRAMGSNLGEPIEVQFEKNQVSTDQMASFLDRDDTVIVKINQIAQKSLTEHVSAHVLDQNTPQAIGVPKRRML